MVLTVKVTPMVILGPVPPKIVMTPLLAPRITPAAVGSAVTLIVAGVEPFTNMDAGELWMLNLSHCAFEPAEKKMEAPELVTLTDCGGDTEPPCSPEKLREVLSTCRLWAPRLAAERKNGIQLIREKSLFKTHLQWQAIRTGRRPQTTLRSTTNAIARMPKT
jgi:hypothetical protein